MLEEITFQSLDVLRDSLIRPHLINARPAPDKMKEALQEHGVAIGLLEVAAATGAVVNGRSIMNSDVVFFSDAGHMGVGQVYFFCSVGTESLCCLSPWQVTQRSSHFFKAVVVDSPCIIPVGLLHSSATYAPANVGNVSTILLQCSFH